MAKYKLPKIEELFDAGVHFGHQVRRWNPNMEKYIFAQRSGIHILDLELTHDALKEAADFLYEVASKGGQIVCVGTKRQASEIVKNEATRAGALYVSDRWLGGTITNYKIIRKNMDKYVDYMTKREQGEFEKYTKKERLLLDRAIAKLERAVGGIVTLQGKPDAVFIVDTRREKTVVREAISAGVPIVALLDTNCDPREVDYVIPGNDDAIRSIAIVMKVVADAIEAGYEQYAKNTEKEKLEKEKALEKAKKEEEKKTEKEAKETPRVSGTESTHVSKDVGKKHAKKVELNEDKETKKKDEKKPTKTKK